MGTVSIVQDTGLFRAEDLCQMVTEDSLCEQSQAEHREAAQGIWGEEATGVDNESRCVCVLVRIASCLCHRGLDEAGLLIHAFQSVTEGAVQGASACVWTKPEAALRCSQSLTLSTAAHEIDGKLQSLDIWLTSH